MKPREHLGPRKVIKVPTSLTRIPQMQSSTLIDSHLEQANSFRAPTKKQLVERIKKTVSIRMDSLNPPSAQLGSRRLPQRKQMASQSKLSQTGKATYRIKSTTKIHSSKQIRSAHTQELKTLDSRIDEASNKKDLTQLLYRRLDEKRSRNMFKRIQNNETSIIVDMDKVSHLRSEMTIMTEEEEDMEFEEFGFKTNRELYKYDLGALTDPSPEQYLKMYVNTPAPHGKCPSYSHNKYIWTDIKLMGYSPQDNKYILMLMDSKQVKRVSRLSIVFKNDNLQQFKKRIRYAKALQQVAMEQLRFEKYIESLPEKFSLTMSRQIKDRIVHQVHRHIGLNTMRSLVPEIQTVYSNFTKKFNTMVLMGKNPLEYQNMRLLPRSFVPYQENPLPRYVGYKQSAQQITNKHYSQFPKFSQSLSLIIDRSYFLKSQFIFAKPSKLMKLPSFQSLQQQTISDNFQKLRKKWRQYLATEIQHTLKRTFDLYSTDDAELLIPSLYMKIHTEMFESIMREDLHMGSVRKWEEYLTGFYQPEKGWEYKYRPQPFIDVQMIVTLPEKRRKRDKTGTDTKREQKDYITIVPTQTEFQQALHRPIAILEEKIGEMTCLEQDLFPTKKFNRFLKVQPYRSPLIQELGDKTYAPLLKFISDMKEYYYLLQQPHFQKLPFQNKTLDHYNLLLSKLQTHRKAIVYTFIHDYHMIRVDLSNFKSVFLERVRVHKEYILEKLEHQLIDEIKKLDKAYEEVRATLNKVPESEEILVELKAYTAHLDNLLDELDKTYKLQGRYYVFLEDHFHQKNVDKEEHYFSLVKAPVEMKLLLGEMRNTLKTKQIEFIETINDERQVLMKTLEDIKMDLKEAETYGPYSQCNKIIQQVSKINYQLQNLTDKLGNINRRERLLKQSESIYEALPKMVKSFEPYYQLWSIASNFENDKEDWLTKSITALNYDMIEKKLSNDYQRQTLRLFKYFANIRNLVAHGVCEEAKKAIQKFREKLWLIENLTCQGLIKKPNLFKQMFANANIPFIELKQLNLNKIMQVGLDKHRGVVQQSSRKAQKIWGIQKKINQINETLKFLQLTLIDFKKTQTFLVDGSEQIMIILDDQYNMLLMLKSSPYIKGILNKANNMQNKITLIRETLQIMMKCQSAWMYLQPIFSSEDIEKQMPLERQKFQGVDKTWRMEMEYFKKEPQIWDSIDSEIHRNRFDSAFYILEEIQKSLSIYLEGKRKLFPRFYFLSDDQLIQILSQTKDPFIINKHIAKCFEAIALLVFSGTKIVAIRSQEGEEISLLSSIDVETPENKGNVEIWLKDIEHQMRESIREVALNSLADKIARTKWILKYPAMIVLSANMTRWTFNTQQAIKSESIRDHFNTLTQQLRSVVDLVRTDLNVLERMTLQALVVIDVHNKDIVEKLLEKDKASISDFLWASQLRYYLQDVPFKRTTRSDIVVRMINASINYCYEYLGNTTRLVITPLTDRCYRTLMGAIDLNYGGAPEGPAGTGKTQTVKDLAKALAVQCVVFNCSDGLNYLAMTKFFKGLASSGAWCCFDEFNRIDLEVLSVIAQQVLTIQTAIKQKRKIFIFDGQDTVLIRSCAINITMNPGYAGRSELPDNLKALFRPCAMMVPDYSMIGEIYLYSVGFQQARELSRKIVASLKLSSEQLSSQDHYDFGMRALKSILTAAGSLKRSSNEDQKTLCLRALLDVNMPKFTQKDMPLFSAITSDLFPGLKLPEGGQEALWNELRKIAKTNKLDIKMWGLKVQQLWAIIKVRHGVMLVGQTLSGKTVAANTLAQVLSTKAQKQFNTTDIIRLNPKSITTQSLYGRLDPASKSWSDGVLPLLMRKCIAQQDGHFKWITFDGPVDAVWIQNMNTVLDDNKKLCLTSGQIIKLIHGMTMMFEVEDLSQASPATVSRCGMVYLEAGMLGWEALVNNMKVPEYCVAVAPIIIEESLRQIQVFFKWKNLKYTIISEEIILVNCFRELLYITLEELEKKKKPANRQSVTNLVFFSLIWSLGSVLDESCRGALGEYLLKQISDIKLPTSNVYDYMFNIDRHAWLEWVTVESKFRLPSTSDVAFHQIIIPTKDTLRNGYLFRQCMTNHKNVLFFGPTGTSKSCTVQGNLKHFHNERDTYLQTSFSGQTTAKQIQNLIQSKMTTRKRHNVFAPEQNKDKLVVFIDQLNMPVKEKYGCQPPLELLRQVIETGGCYDLETKEFKLLNGLVWVSAMLPVKGLTSRLLRHYQLIYVPAFEKDSLVLIFSSIMEWFFTTVEYPFSKELRALSDKIVQGSIKIFHSIQQCKQLLPTPDKSHYVYNLRDLSKVFQGIVKVNGKTISGDMDFIRLWNHQCRRVFQDRMINQSNKQIYQSLAHDVLQKTFRRLDPAIINQPCFYTQLVDGDYKYQPLQTIKATLHQTLADFNSQYRNLKMVLFTSAVEHIVRAVRILSTQGSHLLLIGVGGSGRKSVCKLAVYVCFNTQAMIFENIWDEEVLAAIRIAGLDDRPVTFIVDDRQVTKEDTFEDISNLLNRSEIPRLITGEDKVKLIDQISFQGTPIEKYQFFVNKCKKNLHTVVCMSPMGKQFRSRLRLFPSLVNCTSIDWFSSWPEQALKQTAIVGLANLSVDNKSQLIDLCVKMHQDISQLTVKYRVEQRKYCYVTPTNFLELLSTVIRLYDQRKESLRKDISKYESGVLKIEQTEKEVAKMKEYLEELKPKLERSKKQNQKLLADLKTSQAEADVKRKNCQQEEKQCDKQRSQATRLKDQCQNELNKVLPLLQNAAQTLEKITKDDMVQLRSFPSPPLSAASVMEGMCYVFNEDQNVKAKTIDGEKVQDFWEYSKKNIMNDKLIKRVKEFKVDQVRAIPANKIEKLKIFMNKPEFEKDRVFNASKAAGNLSLWIRAVVDTYQALLVVDPKKHVLSLAQKQLYESEMLLKSKQQALNAVLAILKQLQDQYEKARKEKEELQAKVNKVKTQLQRAEKLIIGLSTEKEAWRKRAVKLQDEGITIIGDSILGAGIMNYLGPFPLNYRQDSIDDWKKQLLKSGIKINSQFGLQELFGDVLVISQWTNIMKLPNDPVSIDNAIIMKKSRRFPLLIDPQDQALIYIKNLESNRKLLILKPSTPAQEVLFKLETCLQLGMPVLLQNVKQISNVYTPLLEKDIHNGRLRYGDKIFSYSDDFMFYMTTKDENQHFPPETCMLVTLLNFSITRVGLTNQLQNMLLTSLYPMQSQNLSNAYVEISSLSHRLLETEQRILELLEKTSDILKDDELIEVLERSKNESVEAQERLKKCEQTKKDIEVIRKGLYNQADIYSNWYFVTEPFVFLESVYRWSLDGYKALLQRILGTSRDLHVITKNFFDVYFHYINRSLFEKDKLQFVLLIGIANLLRQKKIKNSEVRMMMVGPSETATKPNPYPELSAGQWNAVCELEDLCPPFKKLSSNDKLIKQLIKVAKPSTQVAWEFNYFYLLLLVRFIRPDKFIETVYEFIKKQVGEKYLESPPFNLAAAFAQTKTNIPLLFLMTTGADPRLELVTLAQSQSRKVQTVSLGQGQKDFALKTISTAMKQGQWVLLQNCHLSPSFMPELEKLYENFPEAVSDSFRLFLTSMPTDVFPVSVLTNSVKITFQPPGSLKNTLIRLFGSVNPKEFEESSDTIKTIVFNLSFFHSILLERRRFGPVGWNIPYEFTISDFQISLSAIKQFIELTKQPWEMINYMVGQAYYGGRVTDPMDRRFLMTLLEQFMNADSIQEGYLIQGKFTVPEVKTLQSYIDTVNKYPIVQSTQVFGLHENAAITSQILKTSQICSSILSILPQQVEGGRPTLEVLQDVAKKLPEKPAKELIKNHPIKYEQSINTVLHQELERYLKLYNRIQKDIKELIQAQKGQIQSTASHDEILRSILDNRVPKGWGSGSLASWLELFNTQIRFLNNWLKNGQPKSFLIPCFIFPQGFFTAILQNYSRKYQLSVDKLRFEFKVINKAKSQNDLAPDSEGCYIHGLILQAGRWSREHNRLEQQNPKELYCPMPFILVKPTKEERIVSDSIYSCPVYKTSERRGVLSTTGHSSNFILEIDLPTKQSPGHWVLRGLAMIASI